MSSKLSIEQKAINVEIAIDKTTLNVEIETQVKYTPRPREPTILPKCNDDFSDILTLYELAKI